MTNQATWLKASSGENEGLQDVAIDQVTTGDAHDGDQFGEVCRCPPPKCCSRRNPTYAAN